MTKVAVHASSIATTCMNRINHKAAVAVGHADWGPITHPNKGGDCVKLINLFSGSYPNFGRVKCWTTTGMPTKAVQEGCFPHPQQIQPRKSQPHIFQTLPGCHRPKMDPKWGSSAFISDVGCEATCAILPPIYILQYNFFSRSRLFSFFAGAGSVAIAWREQS